MRSRLVGMLLAVPVAVVVILLRHYYGICLARCGGAPWWSSPVGLVVGAVGISMAMLALVAIVRRAQQR